MIEELAAAPIRPYLFVGGSLVAGFVLRPILLKLLSWIVKRTAYDWDDILLDVVRPPLAPAVILFILQAVFAFSDSTRSEFPGSAGFLGAAWTIVAAWAMLRALGALETWIERRVADAGSDNLRQRSLATRVRVARRIASSVIVFLAFSLCLLHFEEVRRLGTGLLTSAGIAGIVIGLSAQKALGNLLAGIQIAFSQPIRLDDVVVVEGEWGRVEEITLTYVVVRIWDRRTLILPISYFLEKPFQNWTRTSADLLGTVTFETDPAVDVEAVRRELERVVHADPLWDGKVCLLQVTETTSRSITLRALVSTEDSGKGWDLRCNVRERILEYLRAHHPEGFPRTRVLLPPETRSGVQEEAA